MPDCVRLMNPISHYQAIEGDSYLWSNGSPRQGHKWEPVEFLLVGNSKLTLERNLDGVANKVEQIIPIVLHTIIFVCSKRWALEARKRSSWQDWFPMIKGWQQQNIDLAPAHSSTTELIQIPKQTPTFLLVTLSGMSCCGGRKKNQSLCQYLLLLDH